MAATASRGHVKPPRRAGEGAPATRSRMLDVTEHLMLEEGYAAVTTRRVAKEIGLTPALVHYYFPTTDDLLIATYQRANERNFHQLTAALASAQPLRQLWQLDADSVRTGLWIEFMALANHRKAIKTAIAEYAVFSRALQAKVLKTSLAKAKINARVCSPQAMSVLLTGIARALVMEENLGIFMGHDDMRATVERFLRQVEPAARSKAAKLGSENQETGTSHPRRARKRLAPIRT